MPLLAQMLASLFGSIAGFFAEFVGKRLAVSLTAIATISAMTAALYAALSLLLNGITAQLPAMPGAQIGMWVACPPNLPTCFAALLSVDTTVALYKWGLKNVQMINR